MNIIKEQEPVKKNTRAIIAQYVDRKDLHGLAEFARAIMEDSMNERSQLLQEIEEINKKYQELLDAVASKFPNETRHETALKYIQEREHRVESSSPSKVEEIEINSFK